MIPFYKSLGFVVKNFNQYYITNLKSEDQKISIGLKRTKQLNNLRQKDLIFDKIEKLIEIKKKINKNF